MIKATLDISKVTRAIDKLRYNAYLLGPEAIKDSANEYAKQLKQNITSQKYGSFGKPYGGESKGKWKKKRQGDYWYWLGTVYKSIQAKKIKEDKMGVAYRVGVTGYTERTVTKD